MSAQGKRILLLDDETEFVDACARILKNQYQVVKTSSPFEAISLLDASRTMIDLVICDYNMPGMNGLELLQELKKMKVKVPVMLLTGTAIDAMDQSYSGFVKIIEKPFNGEKLLSEISALFQETRRIPQAALNSVLLSLESLLKERGLNSPGQLDPESALQILGPGEAHRIFLAWHHLKALGGL